MKKCLLPALLFLVASAGQMNAQQAIPPKAERIQHTIHGSFGDREDPYYWISDRDNPKVIDYLKAENAYTEAVTAPYKKIQEQLFKEMVGRIKEDDNSVPYKKGNYWYYDRYEKGGEYPIFCRKKGTLDAKEEVLVDGNELAKGHNFLSYEVEVSPDETKACIIMDVHGRNFYTIRVRDLQTKQWLSDEVPGTRNGCVWSRDNNSFVYGVPDTVTLRVYQVKRHFLGMKASDDKLLFEEKDPTLDIYVYGSRSEDFIFAYSGRTDANTVWFADARDPRQFKQVAPLVENVVFNVDHVKGEEFTILTNYKAKNYRLCSVNYFDPRMDNWQDIIPGRDDVFLTQVQYFSNFMVAEEVQNGLTMLRVIVNDKTDVPIKFDEPAYYATLGYNPDYHATGFRYHYSSLITPFTTYHYDVSSSLTEILKQQEIPSGYKKDLYKTERIMVTARDGKQVPLTISYRTDMFHKNGTNPGFIYGYGSYGYSNEDYFDANILSLLDRGFVYANTHIRGGQEMGGEWYDDGKMMNKKNTFYDFIDCSIWLQKNNYVASDKLFANGGSAGGLLMGAILNMAPTTFKGVIADVPFVDVITTMEDESIPLTTFEWLEWGNPKIKEQYDYMMSYSPYDNVSAQNYPNILVTTGLNDSQVQYFEPTKWVAKLRYTKTDKNMLLLKVNMDAGHGGRSGRFESVNEVAFMYAFMLQCLGI